MSDPTPSEIQLTGEQADLLEFLTARRHFLRYTVRNLTDVQAAASPTASELSLGGLIKHVSRTEAGWAGFALGQPSNVGADKDFSEWDASDWEARAAEFRMLPGETLQGLLDQYAATAEQTDDLVRNLPDPNRTYPLPAAPWFEPGARRSVRQVFLHIAAETAQHAGHADIIRETIDGARSMG